MDMRGVLGPDVLRWVPPVVTMAVVSIAVSYIWPMFSLLMEREGYSGLLIGLNATAAALMMVISAPLLPRIMGRVGLIPLVIGSALAAALAMALVPLSPDIWWWGLLRMVLGFTITALFFVSEYWLVEIAPQESRGRIVALYAIVLSLSYAIGPKLLAWVGIETYGTYAVPAAIMLAGLLPILAGRRFAPRPKAEGAASPLQTVSYFRSDPLILWGVVLFGMIEFGAMGLLSVWALRNGMEEAFALGLLSFLAIGSVLFQLPVGWAADRFDRRRLLAVAGFAATVAPLLMIQFVDHRIALVACVILLGGMAVSLYTLALTELGARYQGAELAAGNAAVVLAYGFGAFMAPAAFGQAMDLIPPDGLLLLAAASGLAYTLLAVARICFTAR
ncbi:MAG: MFS transporter [Pseudomonadota bacterium]